MFIIDDAERAGQSSSEPNVFSCIAPIYDMCAPFFGMLLGQGFDAYWYLPTSLKNFPTAPQLKVMMEQCGWKDVCFHYLNGGLVAIHIGTKR